MELAEFSKETLADIQVRPIERSEETQYQQQMARHHYPRLAFAECWFARVVTDRTPRRERLAEAVRSSPASAGDVCRSTTFLWRRLPCRQLDRAGTDPRLSAHPCRLHPARRLPQTRPCAVALP